MTKEPTSSAVSKCCMASVFHFNEIGYTLSYLCSKCNQPCDISEAGGSKAYPESDRSLSSPPFVQSSPPDQREIEKLIEEYKYLSDKANCCLNFDEKWTKEERKEWTRRLIRLTNSMFKQYRSLEARNKKLEADKAKLLADWTSMKEFMKTRGTRTLVKLGEKTESVIVYSPKEVRKALSSISYTDSPTE